MYFLAFLMLGGLFSSVMMWFWCSCNSEVFSIVMICSLCGMKFETIFSSVVLFDFVFLLIRML